ncbi:MAG: bifunctional DNA-formamidopyrimidine glycosylase/DNA-(apurinic or apyrimidinic site) lyase [Succinivibrionaceae bacterium]|nr:bifunctional DNA-formamidopyrimidine glycosylase/DNA-(apurinic or apyrimidinic site) lyase [Succinivibrionaceae bacterium]
MPELPEVEVTKTGLMPLLQERTVKRVNVYNANLRFKITEDLKNVENHKITGLYRRAKYIIVSTDGGGSFVIHLGMTGHLKVIQVSQPLVKHDHYEMILDNGMSLRYNDPRRFGAIVWTSGDPLELPFLSRLGVEPLTDDLNPVYLLKELRKRKTNLKQTLMNNEIVVGIGNIYASEILFSCNISPCRRADSVTENECELLVEQIKLTLQSSIEQGGTTIRDFSQVDGKPGYFVQKLKVYGKSGEPCPCCGSEIIHIVQGQRSTYYCPNCQK